MWSEVVVLFREYMGTGLIVMWFLISLVYLWVNEKRKEVRILFLYLPVVLLVLYFNPLFAEVVYRAAGSEVYYRILWLLPVTAVNAYTCVHICLRTDARKRRLSAVTVLAMAGMAAVSGSYIYSNPFFHRAENLYHVPDSVVHICDAINVPGREVMAVFPLELVQYVRQYSPVTCMPYGREVTVDRWNSWHPLCEAMEAERVSMEKIAPLVREAGCHYVILRGDKEIEGNPEDYGWIWFGETDGYVIYRDPARELEIPPRDPAQGDRGKGKKQW